MDSFSEAFSRELFTTVHSCEVVFFDAAFPVSSSFSELARDRFDVGVSSPFTGERRVDTGEGVGGVRKKKRGESER